LERLLILAPALVLSAFMLTALAAYSILCALGRRPHVEGIDRRKFSEIIGPFLTGYFLWMIQPVERLFVNLRVHPNVITFASLLVCAGAGGAIATRHLATAAWLYILAGMLDILDGRLARATNQSSKAGAFLDSVADRWGELFVFSGFAWYLRDSAWLAVVMLTLGSSLMVSYTRARGESLGVKLDGGTMQRAERIMLVSIGTLITSWFDAANDTAEYGPHVIGVALAMVGLASTLTAIHRWLQGYRVLKARERGEARLETTEPAAAKAADKASGKKVKVTVSSKQRPAT
jgi:CDP-diacylglycerol--glycerol-3-phosphate 3-phosphatidyltransferase